jgi:alpha-aminoadipate carrier protein LysW
MEDNMKNLKCIICKEEIKLTGEIMTGEIIECNSCGQEHEIKVENDVISIDLAPEIEETWGE